jgi:hypothetical protein
MTIFLTVGLLLTFSCSAWATMVMPSSLEYMSGRSSAIVIGTVTDQSADWEGGQIITTVNVELSEVIKSPAGGVSATIQLKLLGGKVGDVGMDFDHSPTFYDGEEVLLFLIQDGARFVPYAIYYGVYRVSEDANGQKYVSGPLFDNPVVVDLATRVEKANPEYSVDQELSSFVDRIKSVIQ